MDDYLAYVTAHRKSAAHLRTYIAAYIVPRLGRIDTAELTTGMIRDWHRRIAEEPPRVRTSRGRAQQYRAEDPDPEEALRKLQIPTLLAP